MNFSFQLYSARNFPPLDDLLFRIAGLGYRQVEGYGGLYTDPADLSALLRKHGLSMPTAHFGLSQLEDIDGACQLAETIGIRYLYCPAIPKEMRSPDAAKWVELGEKLAGLGEAYRGRGFGFGWHNHDFEFKPVSDGRLPMDILLETAPLNDWEMDVAWVVRGGQDPLDWIARYGSRIHAVHVKDLAPEGQNADEDGWADVGHGRMDWSALAKAIKAQANAQYWVMEHDNPSDVDRFARRSIEFANSWE